MIDTQKSIPKNVDMEHELLGSLLLKEGKIIPQIAAIINPDDFSAIEHQILFKTILDIFSRGVTPNLLNIVDALRSSDEIDKVGYNYVLSLGQVAFTTAYSEDYAYTIKKYSLRRKLIDFAHSLADKASNNKVDFYEVLSGAQIVLRAFENDSAPTPIIDQCHYFNNFFINDIKINEIYAKRQTGFSNIDEKQIFSPGLYVIGATPAAGKTTFAWQLLNQLAKNGESCIFCSYEMSRLELYTKTFSREMFMRDKNQALSAADIRKGIRNSLFEDILIESCKDKFPRVNLLELQDESVDDLLKILKPLVNNSKDKSPVVCLDYLQIVPSNDRKLLSDKAKIDDIVRKLKTFQRETNTTFIVISSFNRMNYYAQVSFESFKESGNIEYSADVVWALQLNVVNLIKFGDSVSDTRKKFDDAKKQQPRQIQLKCLKNRQGTNYDCFFEYYSAHDFFQPCDGFVDNNEDNSSSTDNDNENSSSTDNNSNDNSYSEGVIKV